VAAKPSRLKKIVDPVLNCEAFKALANAKATSAEMRSEYIL
jgi:hypothetical protein